MSEDVTEEMFCFQYNTLLESISTRDRIIDRLKKEIQDLSRDRDAEIDRLKKELDAAKKGRPSWEDAPPAANWLAMDGDFEWHWYEEKPRVGVRWSNWLGEICSTPVYCKEWRETLEQRPVEVEQ